MFFEPAIAASASDAPVDAATTSNAVASAANATDQELTEVVVQAQKDRQVALLQSVSDQPVSISIVGGDELANLDAYNISDILQRTANAHWNFGTPRTGSISLRGVNALAGTNQQPSVGTTLDGVSYADTALFSIQDFFDIDNLQVIRGATGTSGGKNSNLGALQITSRAPSFDPDYETTITLGERGTVKGLGAAGGTVIDGLLAWRGTFFADKQQGPYVNVYNPDAQYLNTDRDGGRLQFLLTPVDHLTALFSYYYTPNSHEYVNGLAFNERTPATYIDGTPVNQANASLTRLGRSWFARDPTYGPNQYLASAIDNDVGGPVVFHTEGATSVLTWQAGPGTLKSITAYNGYTQQAQNDDGTPFDITKEGGYIHKYNQHSSELRWESAFGKWADYTTGLYYLRSHFNTFSRTQYGSDAGAWYANASQYTTLNADGAGQSLLSNSLNRLWIIDHAIYDYKTAAAFGHIDWHLGSKFTLSTGVRATRERRSDLEGKLITDEGYGQALDPVANDNVNLGGFTLSAANGNVLAASNSATQRSLADSIAAQIFRATVTPTPGAAFNALTPQQRGQVAAAQAVRAAQISGLYPVTEAQPFEKTIATWEVAPVWQFDEHNRVYAAWQRGEKPGIAQFINGTASGGNSTLIPAETSNNYEVGVKTLLFNNTLDLNADLFYVDIQNYQQSLYFYDDYLTKLLNDGTLHFISGTGAAPKVVSRGVEVDGVYNGIPYTLLRFSGAYADARYRAQTLLGQPVENADATSPYFDANGRTLPNSPKFTGNVGVDFRYPILNYTNFHDVHATANYFYTTSYNNDASLSSYSVVSGYGLLDLSLSVGRTDGRFDIGVIAKNVVNTQWRYQGWTSWVPSPPRWIGLQIRARF